VLAATRPPTTLPPSAPHSSPAPSRPSLPYADAVAPAFLSLLAPGPLDAYGADRFPGTDYTERRASSCQKLLFSATLARDPGRLAALDLREPRYFVVGGGEEAGEEGQVGAMVDVAMEKFSVPETLRVRAHVCTLLVVLMPFAAGGLQEHYIVTSTALKPLALMHLVRARGVRNALVFAKSAESAGRLVRLVAFFEDARLSAARGGADEAEEEGAGKVRIEAYSSDLAPGERRSVLERFKRQEIDMCVSFCFSGPTVRGSLIEFLAFRLVCSDLVARGVDIAHVAHVVSYDAPVDVRKYVHRVGRTARAGREGDAWSLVEEQEVRPAT
jgi:ATP-dependent RNA helicase DDX51/DBP6